MKLGFIIALMYFNWSGPNLFGFSINISKSKEALPKGVARKTLKDIICYNQGTYIQYYTIAHDLHRNLRIAVETKKTNADLKELKDRLDLYLNTSLKNVCDENFRFLQLTECLSKPGLPDARVCLKSFNDISTDRHAPRVFDVFRLDFEGRNETQYAKDNTGFDYVLETGKYYIENNLPDKAKKNLYLNPRLDRVQLNHYKTNRIVRWWKKNDDDWVRCWKGYSLKGGGQKKPDYSSAYKSTLIVPLTIWNNKKENEFLRIINKKLDFQYDDPGPVYGFLCFDHQHTDFFVSDDVDVAYIFADILSLFLFTRLLLTSYSSTYKEALDRLKGKD